MEENKQAILLLSANFSTTRRGDPTPLTPLEYGRFARWLQEHSYQPADLFHRFDELSEQWLDPKGKITADRLAFLLGRGMAMGLALEKWQSAGIWVLSRSDSEYPLRLKQSLGTAAPAVLFGVGNKRLLNVGGLAIVGSREIDESDQVYTSQIAKKAALERLNVVSGGARGVDEIAMIAALEADGTAVGVVANGLFKATLATKWRRFIKQNQLVLVSPFQPEAPFNVGNAMGRNKYIYAISDYALAVRSEAEKGGTWAGAIENLRKGWAPLFVKLPSDGTGNEVLCSMGAAELDLRERKPAKDEWLTEQLQQHRQRPESSSSEQEEVSGTIDEPPLEAVSHDSGYEEFTQFVLQRIQTEGQVKLSELKELRTELRQRQLTEWLDRMEEEGRVERMGRLRTYNAAGSGGKQIDIFES